MFGRNSRQIFHINSLQMNSHSFQDSFWVCEILRKNENWTLRWLDLRFCARWRFQRFVFFTPKLGEDFQFDEHIFQMGGSTTNQCVSFPCFFLCSVGARHWFVSQDVWAAQFFVWSESLKCWSGLIEFFLGRGWGQEEMAPVFFPGVFSNFCLFKVIIYVLPWDSSPINHSKEIFFQSPNKQS